MAPREERERRPGSPLPSASDLWALGKPRITGLVTGTAVAGYLIGAGSAADPAVLATLAVGTGLAAAGTNALNQWMERDRDARMERTRERPLPAGRVAPRTALVAAVAVAAGGVALLWWGVGSVVALLAALTVLSYVLLYTPLKTVTPLCTHVGTLPGALPVLGGWIAATGSPGPAGWGLFAVLVLWQLPHFFALDWLCREDYARAGFRTVAVEDPEGRRSALLALGHAALLVPVSLVPLAAPELGAAYGAAAAAAGLGLLVPATGFALDGGRRWARRTFLVTLAYLPAVLGAGVVDALA